jgi:hypothetical protein
MAALDQAAKLARKEDALLYLIGEARGGIRRRLNDVQSES